MDESGSERQDLQPVTAPDDLSSSSVVIASDHVVLRQCLAEALAAHDISVVGQGSQDPQTIYLVEQHKPDVLVVDLALGGKKLEEYLAEVRESSPETRVVVTTRFDSLAQARKLLADGVSAYLGKSATMEELLSAVRTARNRQWDTTVMVISQRPSGLTDRELEILSGVARGLSNTQIASNLHVSEATVKRHLVNVYQKMRVGSRLEAVRKGIQQGWIPVADLLRYPEEDLEDNPSSTPFG